MAAVIFVTLVVAVQSDIGIRLFISAQDYLRIIVSAQKNLFTDCRPGMPGTVANRLQAGQEYGYTGAFHCMLLQQTGWRHR